MPPPATAFIAGIPSLRAEARMRDGDAPDIFRVENLSCSFRGRPSLRQWLTFNVPYVDAVKHVSLTLRKGEVLGIIGESGSGKSTLGYLLARLEKPTSGSILFHGQAVGTDADGERLFRRRVQMIFQDSMASLNPRRRVVWAIKDALRLGGMPASGRNARTLELAQLVGLSPGHLQAYPHELSGGQRQRISIARALAMDPEVIVADEPVSALDVSLQGQIVNLLMDLKAKLGLSIVLISHDLAVVRNVSDRVAVMFGGRVVEYGPTGDIIASARHPYTEELIASVPKGVPGTLGASAADAVNDEEPAEAAASGCPYAQRCSYVMEQCNRAMPAPALFGATHRTLCHRYPPAAIPAASAAAGSVQDARQ
jgi:oligopeptide/dipeptide ABC transporter ATP-binding protein